MFSTFRQRLLLGVYIFIILSIPVGAYLASQTQIFKSKASESKDTKVVKSTPLPTAKPTTSPAKELLNLSESDLLSKPIPSPSPTPTPASPTIATSFGATLSLKASLEGRPKNNQATKLFVGIAEKVLSTNPKFLLSFTVDLPKEGIFSNLSLAGLSPGTKYTALLKGKAQIATSSAFVMSPTVTNLNDGQALNMLSGDLNEDNVINSLDYTIAQKALGSTAKSPNWNELADFNKDGVVNIFDLGLISKNLGQIGASGAWTSPIPKTATRSAGLALPTGESEALPVGSAVDGSTFGYWLWIPKIIDKE